MLAEWISQEPQILYTQGIWVSSDNENVEKIKRKVPSKTIYQLNWGHQTQECILALHAFKSDDLWNHLPRHIH